MHNKPIKLVLLHNEVTNAIRASGGPVFAGDGGIDYLCAACGSPLCIGMREGDMAGLALVCGCGWSNRVPWRNELSSGEASVA